MARTGRFGRLPRAAPSLASTIVALVREMQAQEDQNMRQAWEEGGMVDGKKVTDQMMLDHIRKRRDALDKDDPLWEQWDIQLDNYTFSIEESKMSLKYAEKKVGEAAMANFYTTWAKKLPKDSEAYRELMRSAAQFRDAAATRGGGGGGGGGRGRGNSEAQQAAYDAASNNAYDRYERKWDESTQVLMFVAYNEGILQETDTTDPDDLLDLRRGDERDHARFMGLFDVIYDDPRGVYGDVRQWLADNGMANLSYDQWVAFSDTKVKGLDARLGLANQFGDKSGAKDLAKDKASFQMMRAQAYDIDDMAVYQTVRGDLDAALATGVSPFEALGLFENYRDTILELSRNVAVAENSGFFNNEILNFEGADVIGPSAAEGNEGGTRSRTAGDVAQMGNVYRQTRAMVESILSGRSFLTEKTNKDGQPEYDHLLAGDPRLRDPNLGALVLNTQPGRGRMSFSVPTYVEYTPMYVEGIADVDPRTGQPMSQVKATGSDLLGVTFTLNGKEYYGLYHNGQLEYYAGNPEKVFASNATFSTNNDGSVLISVPISTEQVGSNGVSLDEKGNPVFDPYLAAVAPARQQEDDELRFNDAMRAMYSSDAKARVALLTANEQTLANTIMAQYGEGPEAERKWQELRVMRNDLVRETNARRERGWSADSMGFRAANLVGTRGRLREERGELPALRETEDVTVKGISRYRTPESFLSAGAQVALENERQNRARATAARARPTTFRTMEDSTTPIRPGQPPQLKVPQIAPGTAANLLGLSPTGLPTMARPIDQTRPLPVTSIAPRPPAPKPTATPKPEPEEEDFYSRPEITTPTLPKINIAKPKTGPSGLPLGPYAK